MSSEEAVVAEIIAEGTLGPHNLGDIGPSSEQEALNIRDCADSEYLTAPVSESHCMDDRVEALGVQLAGNRAVTEIAGDYMNPASEELPLSQRLARKSKELELMGRPAYFHKGCAALLALTQRDALRYNAQNADMGARLSMDRLRLVGIDSITLDDLKLAIQTGGTAAANENLWDCSREQAVEIACQNGAAYEEFEQPGHAAAGAAWLVTEQIFDNGAFRRDHQTDDGTPQGVLVLSLGGYKKQLEEDGFSADIVAQKLMHATLYAVGVLKLAEKPGAPDAIIGYAPVLN